MPNFDIALPNLIAFSRIGKPTEGYISVAEVQKNIPFDIKRVYWTYYTPYNVQRGGHAHHDLYQVLIAVSGRITISTESREGNKADFLLENPDSGLFLPPPFWHTMQFSHNAVLLSLCSMEYKEADYIRNYALFKENSLL